MFKEELNISREEMILALVEVEKNTSSVVVVRPQPDSEAHNVAAVRQRIENAYHFIAKRTELWR